MTRVSIWLDGFVVVYLQLWLTLGLVNLGRGLTPHTWHIGEVSVTSKNPWQNCTEWPILCWNKKKWFPVKPGDFLVLNIQPSSAHRLDILHGSANSETGVWVIAVKLYIKLYKNFYELNLSFQPFNNFVFTYWWQVTDKMNGIVNPLKKSFWCGQTLWNMDKQLALCEAFNNMHMMHWELFFTTRFQLILPVDSHNVTKNLTGHKMHIAGPQICQINRCNNSFQNMYGVL